jgi:cytochrome c553
MRNTLRRAARLSAGAGLLALSLSALAQSPAAPAELARNLAATCANCHGTNGLAVGEAKPLAGALAERTVALMTYFKTTPQPAGITIMHQIAKGYSDEQIKLIAAYFATQPARK